MTIERKCSKPGCGALEVIGKSCTDWDCPQQYIHHTHAAPDVPNLVRYSVPDRYDKVMPDGEYVLHSQAAEIIAAKDTEIANFQGFLAASNNVIDGLQAKLALYEAQVPITWVDENGMAAFTLGGISTVHTQFEFSKSERFRFPLYASPAPAEDLKAENKRLQEAIEYYADKANWESGDFQHNVDDHLGHNVLTLNMPHAVNDQGKIARAALNVEASND